MGEEREGATEAVPLTRTIMLHTGGSFWVDVTGIEGTRDSVLLRWVPGSPRIELGLLPSALMSLPLLSDAWGRRVSHFMLGLSPRGPSPVGESGQLAVAMSTLWYRHAANAGLPLVRAGGATPESGPFATTGQPLVVLTGSGVLRQRRTGHGLFGYRVEPVYGWEDKLRQLDAAVAGLPVAALHLVCAHVQLAQVRAALLHALPDRVQPGDDDRHFLFDCAHGRVGLHLHPVATLSDVVGVVDGLAAAHAAGPGRTAHLARTARPVPGTSRTGVPARRRTRTAACRVVSRSPGPGRHRMPSEPIAGPPGPPGPPGPKDECSGRQGTAGYELGAVGVVRVILIWLLIGSLGALLGRHCAGLPRAGPEPAAGHGAPAMIGTCKASEPGGGRQWRKKVG